MDLPQPPKPTQKLNQEVVQSLHMLQLPLHELSFYLQEQAEANPMLHVEPPKNPLCIENPQEEFALSWGDPNLRAYDATWHQEEIRGWSQGGAPPLPQIYKNNPKTFTQQLVTQLRQAPQIPPEYLPHCIFFAESLDSRGYFVEDLSNMAQLLQITLKEAEEVLRMVQQMKPTGVAARNLEECLMLQLAKTTYCNRKTLTLIAQDPVHFQPVDFKWMAKLMDTTVSQAQIIWQNVRGLHPFPSAVDSHRPTHLIPEAVLRIHQGTTKVEHHKDSWCRVALAPEALEPQEAGKTSILGNYHRDNVKNAESILVGLSKRRYILDAIISFVVAYQQDFFLQEDRPLKPLGVSEIADFLELHPTWVSRALCDKYLLTPQGMMPLKALLSAPPPPAPEPYDPDDPEDREEACTRLQLLIAGEDKTAPFSDAKLQVLLEGFHIFISRRTVAKYRGILDIPNASQRREEPENLSFF